MRRNNHRVRTPLLATIGAVLAALVFTGTGATAALPGDPDPSFGDNGIVRIDLGKQEGARAVFEDARGRVLLVGGSIAQKLVLLRLNPDGSRDQSFGTRGRVSIDPTTLRDATIDASRGPGGKVVVLASRASSARTIGYTLVRVRASGELDRSFGGDGVVTGTFGKATSSQTAEDVLVQPDSRVLVLGVVDFQTAVLRRYLSDGRLDRGFGANGTIRLTGFTFGSSVLRQADGRIVVAGATGATHNKLIRARRFRANGAPDRSFGTNGVARLTVQATGADMVHARDALIAPNGRIYIVGQTWNASTWTRDALIASFTPRGEPATGFGGSGWRILDYDTSDRFLTIADSGDGRIVVAGGTTCALIDPEPACPGTPLISVLRPNGSLDADFGQDGTVITQLIEPSASEGEDPAWSGISVRRGRIVVAGYSTYSVGNADFIAGRFLMGS